MWDTDQDDLLERAIRQIGRTLDVRGGESRGRENHGSENHGSERHGSERHGGLS